MNSFLKNLMYVVVTALIFAVPVLLTLSLCLNWDEAIQGALCVLCLFDFLAVWVLVIAFEYALK